MKHLVGSVVAISLLTAFSAFAQEKPASGPGTSGGGVSLCTITEGNKLIEKDNCEQLLDSHMRKSRVNVQELEAYKKYVGPRLAELEKILPDFAAELREAFEEKDWFMSNLKQKIPDLGKEGNGTDLPVKQRAVQYQDSEEIWAEKDWYDRQPTDEQADFLWHEALVHIRLKSSEAKKLRELGKVYSKITSDEERFRPYGDSIPSMEDVRRVVVVIGANSLPGVSWLQRKIANHNFGIYLTASDSYKVKSIEQTFLKKMQQACQEDDKNGKITKRMYAMGLVMAELNQEIHYIDRSNVVRNNNLVIRAESLFFAYDLFRLRLNVGDEDDYRGIYVDLAPSKCDKSRHVIKDSKKYCRIYFSRTILPLNRSYEGIYLARNARQPDYVRGYDADGEPTLDRIIGGEPNSDRICNYVNKKLTRIFDNTRVNKFEAISAPASTQDGLEEKAVPAK